MVVDCSDCGLALFSRLNPGRHGGRVPRQNVGIERHRPAWLYHSRRDGHLDAVVAHQGAGWVRQGKGDTHENLVASGRHLVFDIRPDLNGLHHGRGLLPRSMGVQPDWLEWRVCFPCDLHGLGRVPDGQSQAGQANGLIVLVDKFFTTLCGFTRSNGNLNRKDAKIAKFYSSLCPWRLGGEAFSHPSRKSPLC